MFLTDDWITLFQKPARTLLQKNYATGFYFSGSNGFCCSHESFLMEGRRRALSQMVFYWLDMLRKAEAMCYVSET
jgi:hypothetical protein